MYCVHASDIQGEDEVLRCGLSPLQCDGEKTFYTCDDLLFYATVQKRRFRANYVDKERQNIYYVYETLVCTNAWLFVNDYVPQNRELHLTTMSMEDDIHALFKVHFNTKPTRVKGTLYKSSVKITYGAEICKHRHDVVYMYKSIKFENLADNIVEYLIHMLNETFLQTDLYLDCNDYDILLDVVHKCLVHYDILVSPYFVHLFIRNYNILQRNKVVIKDLCACYDNIYCTCEELLNFNFK